ncbi:autotransporter outer membrane beta-barrel domain-containing protein [Allorhizobium pseudoryzae]|uniref:autotransporter outer membrane beta-barrel domain-containing protein n=1 Tax=Allorhizobium pseudoryzae TaxID=379684 RepID=UPI003CFBEF75
MLNRFPVMSLKQAWTAVSVLTLMGVFPAGAQTLSGTGTLTVPAGTTWTSNADNSSSVWSGNLQGDGNFQKAGTGTLTFNGENYYTGSTTVSAGTLVISGGVAVYDFSDVTVNAGATLQVDGGEYVGSIAGSGNIVLGSVALALAADTGATSFSGNLSGAGVLWKNGAHTLTLSGNNTNEGGMEVMAGSLILAGGNAVADTATLTLSGGTAELQNSETVGALAGTSGVNINGNILTVAGSGNSTYSGTISGTGALIKSGSGTQILSGSNTYSGTTTVAGGILSIASDGNLGGGALTLNGGTLAVTGSTTIDNSVTLGASSGTIETGSNPVTFSGAVGGSGSLTKTGAGTLTLSGASSYTGTTNIDAGTLLVSTSSALAKESTYVVASGATFQTSDGVTNEIGGLSGAGDVILGDGTLTVSVEDGGTNIFSGTISGTGSFEKGDLGTLILTGASNTLDAGLRMSGGILEIDGGAFTTGGDLNMTGGRFDIKNGGSLTSEMVVVEGVMEVSGGSTVTANDYTQIGVLGNSTLTIASSRMESRGQAQILGLAGSSVAVSGSTGVWTIADSLSIGISQGGAHELTLTDGGTVEVTNGISVDQYSSLRLGTGGQAGTLTAAFINNAGSIQADFAGNLSLDMQISGAGTLTKSGTGTLVITGLVDVSGATTVSSGTLQIGDGGTSGEVLGTIINNGTLIFNRSDQYTVSSQITGTGSITFMGGGSAELTGAYSGSTVVTDGRLALTGSGLSGSQVSLGGVAGKTGTLAGNGTIASLSVLSSGIVAPGNSIGTINVGGPVSFAAGSVYEVEVNANGTSDRIIATGPVTIDGGASVRVLAEAGTYPASTTYTILSGSSLSGSFNPLVSTNFAFLNAALSYSAADVLLTLTRNDISFVEIGVTPNEIAAATGIESLPSASELKTSVTGLSAGGARYAFNQFSGEAHASAAGQALEDSAILRGVALRRLSQEAFDRRFEGGEIDFEGTRVWSEALGSFRRVHAANTTFGFDRNLGGLAGGIETRLTEQSLLGIMAGYTGSHLDNNALGSSVSLSAYHAAVYGSYELAVSDADVVSLRGGVAYSWQDFSSKRDIEFASISQRVEAHYGTGQVQGFGELAYGHMFNSLMQDAYLEGFAGLALVHQDGAKFTETGGSAALTCHRSSSRRCPDSELL